MQRCSPMLLLMRAVDALKVYLPFMLLQGSIAERLPAGFRVVWYVLVAYYTVSRFPLVFFDWLTVRYTVTAEGIVHRAGWPTSVTTRVAWPEVGALQVEQDLVHQLLRRFRVRAVLGANGREDVILEAQDAASVAGLRDFHDQARRSVAGSGADRSARRPVPAAAPAPSARRVIFRAGWRDYLLISVGYGQFVLVVPFLLGAWSDVAGAVGLPDGFVLLDQLLVGGLAALLMAVPAALAFGFAHAWLRFHDYRVSQDQGGYEARGGLLRRDVRQARNAEVCGVRISQNPLMRLVGRSSVSLVLRASGGEFRSLVVLPAAPDPVVRGVLVDLVPGADRLRGEPTRVPAAAIVTVLVTGLAGAAVAVLAQLSWVAAGTGLVAALLANALWVRVERSPDGAVLRHRRGLLWCREYVTPTTTLRWAESWRVVATHDRCVGRLVLMDRRPISLWLPGVPAALYDSLAEPLVRPRCQEVAP